MRKNCLFFGFVLLALALLLSLVSGEIVSSACEREQIGVNTFRLNCSNQSNWMRDVNGVWSDFNAVVDFYFDDSERVFVAEWFDGNIVINPYGVYKGDKYFLKDIPLSIWSDLNFEDYSVSSTNKYKWGFKLNKLKFLTEIGYEVSSSNDLSEFDVNSLWFKFDEVGISFWDLITNDFNMAYSIDANIITVRTIDLPDLSRIDFEPIISPENDYDNQTQRYVNCIPGFGCLPPVFSCSFSAVNPWFVGYDRRYSSDRYWWRSFWEWNTLSIPSNATILDVDVSFERIALIGSPDSLIMATATKPSDASSCENRYKLIDSSTQYESVGSWGVGWNDFDLGEDAVSDLQGHLDWFAAGLKPDNIILGQQNYVGLGNMTKNNGAILTVEYSVPEEGVDEWEEGLIEREPNWFVLGCLCFGIVFFVVVAVKV